MKRQHTISDGAFLFWHIMLNLVTSLYFLPTSIAYARYARSRTNILLWNILLGWTFVGWVAFLVWAICAETIKEIEV